MYYKQGRSWLKMQCTHLWHSLNVFKKGTYTYVSSGSALFAKINTLLIMLYKMIKFVYDQALIHFALIGDKSLTLSRICSYALICDFVSSRCSISGDRIPT